ncbi:MAG: hypothetical protein ACYTGL_19935 [Planctomycetota bacterium]|jgi:hypothetical protein
MTQSIIIVGGIPGDPDRTAVLSKLKERTEGDITWDWVRADVKGHYRPPEKLVRRLLKQIQEEKSGNKTPETTAVKLPLLHGSTQGLLHQRTDPVQVPKTLDSLEAVLDWLFSPEANLVPVREWYGSVREAALMAVLSKLIRNKSWNKNTRGHAWTKEEDLLGQSPVLRRDFQPIAVEARRMMDRLKSCGLLHVKGGTKGTPKEWSLGLKHVPMVKQMVLRQSVSLLDADTSLKALAKYIDDDVRTFRIDGEIVSERVRGICRE